MLFDYVVRNCNGMSPNKVWPYLFNVKSTVRLANILHIAEICIASPLANAESERVFTFLWRLFSKERTLLKNDILKNLLQLRCDFSAQRYKRAIDLFETVYPDGTVRKAARHAEGQCYPTQQISRTVEVSSSKKQINALVQINADDISDDEWSSSSSSNEN